MDAMIYIYNILETDYINTQICIGVCVCVTCWFYKGGCVENAIRSAIIGPGLDKNLPWDWEQAGENRPFQAPKRKARRWFQMSNEKNTGCLGYIGDYTTQLYRDCNKPL